MPRTPSIFDCPASRKIFSSAAAAPIRASVHAKVRIEISVELAPETVDK
jgi:hypothetical protein